VKPGWPEQFISRRNHEYGFFNRIRSIEVFSFTQGNSELALEAHTGCASHPAGPAIADSVGTTYSPVDTKRFRRTGFVQAGTSRLLGQALQVF
jgi:ribosomal protein L34